MSGFAKLGIFFLFLSFINLLTMVLQKRSNELAYVDSFVFEDKRQFRARFTVIINLGTLLMVPYISNSDNGNTFIQIDIIILLAVICAFTCSGIRFLSFPFEFPMVKPAVTGLMIGLIPMIIILHILPTAEVIPLTYNRIAVLWTYISPIIWAILFYPKGKFKKDLLEH
ncbi:MAG: hypothetical protein ACTTGJ_03920 [Clostridium sp.]